MNSAPEVWPHCPQCDRSYVFARRLSFTDGWVWVWVADCATKRCRKNEPVMMSNDGRVES